MKLNKPALLAGVFFLLGGAAYSLPWLTNPGNGLSFGAYDLAEWTSLHPSVRGGNPALLTTLLLRLPLACLGLIVCAGFLQKRPGLFIAVLVVTAIAILPPLEFFTQYQDDPNYQQQFFLALITMITGILLLTMRHASILKPLIGLMAITAGMSSLAGLLHGYSLLKGFALPTHFGLGGIGLIALFVVLTIYFLLAGKGWIKQTR